MVKSTSVVVMLLVAMQISVGCIIVPVTKKLIAPPGVPLRAEPAVSQLGISITNREEVRRSFATVGVWEGSRTFIGRWVWSRVYDTGHGRFWRAKTVLVTFDSDGTVERHKVCNDGELFENLRAFLRVEPSGSDLSILRANWPVHPEDIEKVKGIFIGKPGDPTKLRLHVFLWKKPAIPQCGPCFGRDRDYDIKTDVPTLIAYAHYVNQREAAVGSSR